jgi:hypothetical protein
MRLPLAVLTALVLALASCGGDDDSSGGDSDEDQVTAAIDTFAEGGSGACDVLTDEYIETLFGGRDECEKAAGEGEGSDVEVENVEIDGDTATAEGTADGSTATLTLQKDGDDWKISGIENEE